MGRRRSATAVAALLALGASGVSVAQIEGGSRGVAAVDSSTDYEVSNVSVNVTGPTAEAARLAGWRQAQRLAFAQLSRRLGAGAGSAPDGTLDSIVSSIVVQDEEIGPNRYVARLGVLFDRERTASLLGIASYEQRSPPMLVLPILWSGGAGAVFEQRSAWQEAWARFRTSNSELDYVRPTGNGADPLLLNVGQAGRPARGWWRRVLDLYGATDVVMPTARLVRQWPGGPVVGYFEARHGPDNRLLGSFALRVTRADGLPQLLDTAVRRLDALYVDARRAGELSPDPGLSYTPPPVDPVFDEADLLGNLSDALEGAVTVAPTTFTVQYDTPDAAAVLATERALRAVPGVSGASTSSLALGGVSVASVSFAGGADAFRAALESRGFQVFGAGTTLRVRRVPQLAPPDLTADDATAG